MKRREDRPITKHTMNLYAGDYARLQALYPTRIGAAKIVRDIIHAHIRRVEEKAGQRAGTANHQFDEDPIDLEPAEMTDE
jgi:hypothetical protein